MTTVANSSLDRLDAARNLQDRGCADAFLATEPRLRAVVDLARERIQAREVWLFGSRARGDNSSLSDWDILIVVDDGASEAVLNPGRLWRICRDADLVADVVAERVSDLRASEDVPTTIAYRVKREGIQIG